MAAGPGCSGHGTGAACGAHLLRMATDHQLDVGASAQPPIMGSRSPLRRAQATAAS